MKVKSKKTPIVLACIGIALTALSAIAIIFTKTENTENNINAVAGDSRSFAYAAGSSIGLTKGNVKYLSLKNSTVTLSFTNEAAEEWEPELKIQGFKATGTAMYMDLVGRKGNSYTLTNTDQGYESEFLLYNALKYTVDGEKSDNCVIPTDGKEHIVEINYSYLEENDIELDGDLYIDGHCFVLR